MVLLKTQSRNLAYQHSDPLGKLRLGFFIQWSSKHDERSVASLYRLQRL